MKKIITIILGSLFLTNFMANAEEGVFSIGQNYPNPANFFTEIPIFNLKQQGRLEIRNILGELVAAQPIESGSSAVTINVSDIPSGSYIITIIVVDNFKSGQKTAQMTSDGSGLLSNNHKAVSTVKMTVVH